MHSKRGRNATLCSGTALSCFSTINQIVAQGIMGLNNYTLLKSVLCLWQSFLFQNMFQRDEPPYGSALWWSSAWGGTVRSGELWTEGKSVLKSVLTKRYFGTSSPAAPDTDPERKHTKHLPQKTNKGTRTTAAGKYSPVSFCSPTTLALQSLWHTWHHVPPHSLHSLKILRISLICRR